MANAVCADSTSGYEVIGGLARVFPVLDTSDTYWFDLMIILAIGTGWMIFGIACALLKANQSTKVHSVSSSSDSVLQALPATRNDEEEKEEDGEVRNINHRDVAYEEEAGDYGDERK